MRRGRMVGFNSLTQSYNIHCTFIHVVLLRFMHLMWLRSCSVRFSLVIVMSVTARSVASRVPPGLQPTRWSALFRFGAGRTCCSVGSILSLAVAQGCRACHMRVGSRASVAYSIACTRRNQLNDFAFPGCGRGMDHLLRQLVHAAADT